MVDVMAYRETGMDIDGISIDEVNDIDTFQSLKNPWNELIRQSPDNDIFLTWEWLYYWWKYYGDDKKLRILIIKEGSKLLGIAPFMQLKYQYGPLSVDVLENICSINCDRSGIVFISNNQKVVATLLKYLDRLIEKEKIIIRLSQVPQNSVFSTTLSELSRDFTQSLILTKRVISTCPYILLPETWDIYKNQYCPSKKRLKTLQYRLRSLQKDHAVELKEFDGDDDVLNTQLHVLYELHKQRWLTQTGKSKFTEKRTRDFYFEISKILHQNGWLSLSSLNVDGKPASIIWGFKYNNIWMDMTPVFDPEYSRFSVGQLQIMKMIESMIEAGFTKFDFLKGGSEYKQRWAQNSEDNLQFIITKNGFLSKYKPMLLYIIIKLQNIKERSFIQNVGLLYRRLRYRKNSGGVKN